MLPGSYGKERFGEEVANLQYNGVQGRCCRRLRAAGSCGKLWDAAGAGRIGKDRVGKEITHLQVITASGGGAAGRSDLVWQGASCSFSGVRERCCREAMGRSDLVRKL